MEKARKIAFVTGGGKRIGKIIVNHLLFNGWNVVIHTHKTNLVLNDFRKIEIDQKIHHIRCDLSDLAQTSKIFDDINKNFGQVSLLINNASSFINDNYINFSLDQFNLNMNVNYFSPAILIRDFAKQKCKFPDHAGNIINILDYCIAQIPDNFYTYCLSKIGLKNLIEANVKMLAPNIRINGIAFGSVIQGERQSEENFLKSYQKSLLQLSTTNNEIEAALDFIIKAKTMTGEIIYLDSGKRYQNDLFL